MKRFIKQTTAFLLSISMVTGMAGCGTKRKEPKPTPNPTVQVDDGNADASANGEGQYDTPIVIGTTAFAKKFNPFMEGSTADRQAVSLTQLSLIQTDRAGRIVYHGIDGELREYEGEDYTYYGAADVDVEYDRQAKKTSYHITLRDDLVFSNGEKVTVDDVIFTLYAFCDTSYCGEQTIGQMPITGLLNYQANSTRAQKISDKKVQKYIKKYPAALEKWVNKNIINYTLTQGFAVCREAYEQKGYASAKEYFADLYDIGNVKKSDSEKSFLKKAVSYYQKKGYRALAKAAYQDSSYFDTKIENRARILLSKNTGKKVKQIRGIKKQSEYRLTVETQGYERKMSAALNIPICSLRYYGDAEKFDEKQGEFGFQRGDISALKANRSTPIGAGPYRFVKCESGTVYYTSNENYFAGCPSVAYLHLKDMTDVLKETKIYLEKEEAKNNAVSETVEKTEEKSSADGNADAVKKVAEVEELLAGVVDVISGSFDVEQQQIIASKNAKKAFSGNKIHVKKISDGEYHYIGIHGKNVSVNDESDSSQSKYLRKALATIFSASRDTLKETYGESVTLTEYPIAKESWIAPLQGEDDYRIAYSTDLDNVSLYTSEDASDTKLEKAKEAALQYFEKAGYTVIDEKVTAAPKNAKCEFEIAFSGGENNSLYCVVQQAMQVLDSIGITLKVRTFEKQAELTRYLTSQKQELWIGKRQADDTELLARYGKDMSKNPFGITDKKIVRLAKKLEKHMTSKRRRQYYTRCFEQIMEQAVEVPMCQYNRLILYSSANIDFDSLPEQATVFYGWLNQIHKIQED